MLSVLSDVISGRYYLCFTDETVSEKLFAPGHPDAMWLSQDLNQVFLVPTYNVLNILLPEQVENHVRIIGNKLLSQTKNGNIKSLVDYNEGLSDQCESSYITLKRGNLKCIE